MIASYKTLRGRNNKHTTYECQIPLVDLPTIMEAHPFDEKIGIDVKNKGAQRVRSDARVRKIADNMERELGSGKVVDFASFFAVTILGLNCIRYDSAKQMLEIFKKLWNLDGNHRCGVVELVLKKSNAGQYPLLLQYVKECTASVRIVEEVPLADARYLFHIFNSQRNNVTKSQGVATETIQILGGFADDASKKEIRQAALCLVWDRENKDSSSPFYQFVSESGQNRVEDGVKKPPLTELIRTSEKCGIVLEDAGLVSHIWKLPPAEAVEIYADMLHPWVHNFWQTLKTNMPDTCDPTQGSPFLCQGYKIADQVLGAYMWWVLTEPRFSRKFGRISLEEKQTTFMVKFLSNVNSAFRKGQDAQWDSLGTDTCLVGKRIRTEWSALRPPKNWTVDKKAVSKWMEWAPEEKKKK